MSEDLINHPKHYTSHPSGIEAIDIARHMNFNLGCALKYIWRCDLKRDAIEDLKKAVWYINDEIKRRELWAGNQEVIGHRESVSGIARTNRPSAKSVLGSVNINQ